MINYRAKGKEAAPTLLKRKKRVSKKVQSGIVKVSRVLYNKISQCRLRVRLDGRLRSRLSQRNLIRQGRGRNAGKVCPKAQAFKTQSDLLSSTWLLPRTPIQ